MDSYQLIASILGICGFLLSVWNTVWLYLRDRPRLRVNLQAASSGVFDILLPNDAPEGERQLVTCRSPAVQLTPLHGQIAGECPRTEQAGQETARFAEHWAHPQPHWQMPVSIDDGEHLAGYVCYNAESTNTALHDGLSIQLVVRDACDRKYRKADKISHRSASALSANSLIDVVGASRTVRSK